MLPAVKEVYVLHLNARRIENVSDFNTTILDPVNSRNGLCAMRSKVANYKNMDELVSGLANGLRTLEAFTPNQRHMTVADVAKQTGLTRAAVRRYLHTMTASGYIEFDGKRFQLTPRVLRLGHAYISSIQLPQIAQPIVEELGHKTDESIAFSILDGPESLTIASSTPHRIVGIFTRVGTHLPALSTATGRAMLASRSDDEIEKRLRVDGLKHLTPKTKTSPEEIWEEIHRIRKSGYAINDEEIEIGLRVIAVPVRTSAGVVIASICVSTYSSRYEIDQLTQKFLHPLLDASKRFSTFI
jgi:IclR family pca regulon transcriptional regulator